MRIRVVCWVACCAAMLLLAACGSDKKTGGICQSGSDCDFGCFEGQCVTLNCAQKICSGADQVCVKKPDGSEACTEKQKVSLNAGSEWPADASGKDSGSEDTRQPDKLGQEDLGQSDKLGGEDTSQLKDSTGNEDSSQLKDAAGTKDTSKPDDTGQADSDDADILGQLDLDAGGPKPDSDSGMDADVGGDTGKVPTGDEGDPCEKTEECKPTVCVEKLTQTGVFNTFSQECKNKKCTRLTKIDDCGKPTCSDNKVVARMCVAGACVPSDSVIEDCAAKIYKKNAESPEEPGCYKCEEKDPAQCVLQSVNGQWEAWRVSTPDDDKVKNGYCDVEKTLLWHTHYCNNPPRSCGGIWCYWTTGAPGGPSSIAEPEFRCGPDN